MKRSDNRWRPSPFGASTWPRNQVEKEAALQALLDQMPKLDQSVRALFDQLYGLVDGCLLPPEDNTDKLRVAAGSQAVTGSQKQIVSGLTSVLYLVASLQSAAALNEWVTCEVLTVPAGNFNLYVWKPTAAGDTTPIASTTGRVVHWFAWGT